MIIFKKCIIGCKYLEGYAVFIDLKKNNISKMSIIDKLSNLFIASKKT